MRSLYSSNWLGFAHLLHDHLLGGLRGDAAELHRRQLLGEEIADLGVRVALAGGQKRDFLVVVLDGFHHFEKPLQLHLARVRVDVGADVGFLAIAGPRRLLDRIGHSRDHDALVDRLFAGNRIGDLQQFQPVCTYSHCFVS
jgi:hypothetical protein